MKHDRYNGYDPSEYAKVVERYEAVEALKNEKKKEKARRCSGGGYGMPDARRL